MVHLGGTRMYSARDSTPPRRPKSRRVAPQARPSPLLPPPPRPTHEPDSPSSPSSSPSSSKIPPHPKCVHLPFPPSSPASETRKQTRDHTPAARTRFPFVPVGVSQGLHDCDGLPPTSTQNAAQAACTAVRVRARTAVVLAGCDPIQSNSFSPARTRAHPTVAGPIESNPIARAPASD
ncbi:hypothetical protein B0H16DRAFT_1520312 [Mycena metata]|uniref:Uncharacterized protein n=1 Tax=Mycena metata TaxID=1033252 RepID=A0AAD7JMB3_9AGAR|nr:hypothetical protein B0H16DRAFT_1520312 [Mycena metata]